MKKWETHERQAFSSGKAIHIIAETIKEGWEFVIALPGAEKGEFFILFKREIPEPQSVDLVEPRLDQLDVPIEFDESEFHRT